MAVAAVHSHASWMMDTYSREVPGSEGHLLSLSCHVVVVQMQGSDF